MKVRLLVSYRGAGVELRDDRFPDAPHQAACGAVVVLKGSAWRDPPPPLLHRSAAASRRRPRWLLAMDPT